MPVLLAAVAGRISRHARIGVFELLYQTVAAEPHADEIVRGNTDLAERCRAKAREGLWCLYAELAAGGCRGAGDVLEVIETDAERLAAYLGI